MPCFSRGLLALALVTCGIASTARAADGPIRFNRDIRPILSDTCFTCHGPDKNKRESDLRLDTKEGAFAEADGRAAVVAGSLEKSELIRRITSTDPDVHMPPAKSNRSLTPAQVELLKRWVKEGAVWEGHWAYIAPVRPPVPEVKGSAASQPVDRFIAEALSRNGLKASGLADRVTLARRLYFDLLGLPPTPEQVAAFATDKRPDAYERLVDTLLASPHYGERMALYWLDMVRYADTTGIHGDNHRDVTPFRDYVIKAFNDNKPYDRFAIEQLAGDLLQGATLEQRVASGYNRMNMTTSEGGAQAREYIAKYAADRVRNASTVWMGSTMGCAECHDHKFDPFKTKDFYRFAAFFADVQEQPVALPGPAFPVPTTEQQAQLDALDREAAPLKKQLETQTPELDAAQVAWEGTFGKSVSWTVLEPVTLESTGGATLAKQADGAVLVSGTNPDKDTYTFAAPTSLEKITALRLEVLPDASLPASGPGRAGNGNFVLHEFTVQAAKGSELKAGEKPKDAKPVALHKPHADFSQDGWAIAGAIDGKPQTGWAVMPEFGKPHEAIFLTKEPLGAAGGSTIVISLSHQYGTQHAIGKFRISVTNLPAPELPGAVPPGVLAALKLPAGERNAQQKTELAAHYRGIAPLLAPVRAKLAEIDGKKKGIEGQVPKTLVAMAGQPRMTRVLPRGNWLDESGEVVQPGVPEFLRQIPAKTAKDARATRHDLAEWLIAADNPLFARAFVNRMWKLMFGRGLATPLDDLGLQGTVPTHPELLDWLAVDFRENQWNVKRLLKLLVMSDTYRQSSQMPAELRQKDPYNLYLARQSRYRVDAEMVRDNALAVSGLLVTKIGGPTARPYQPAGYWGHLNFPTREYQADHGENLYRRGLYTYWCRTFLHPSLLAFDAPSREECTVERNRSNTPLQALVLLNDPTYVEAARVFAERILKHGGASPDERITWAFRQATSREPSPAERVVLLKLLEDHQAEFTADKAAAQKLLGVGEWPVPKDVDSAVLAAWTSVARAILNLHETITRS